MLRGYMTETLLSLRSLSKMIDHSLLHPMLTDAGIVEGCRLSRRYDVATACVKPYAVSLAGSILEGSGVGVCAVVAFPHGSATTSMKIRESEEAIANGASEIDMVVNVGKVLGSDWDYVSQEIHAVNRVVVGQQALVKVIFENDYLEDSHIVRLCQICSDHNVAFVKTSTGYGFVRQANGMYTYAGATDHHLCLMRSNSAPHVAIKAAGGVRTLDDLLRVRSLGVSRIGATATKDILEDARKRGFQ